MACTDWLSQHAARDALRAGLGKGTGLPITVRISGDHHLQQPLVLDHRDSGTPTAPVYAALHPFIHASNKKASPPDRHHEQASKQRIYNRRVNSVARLVPLRSVQLSSVHPCIPASRGPRTPHAFVTALYIALRHM